MRILIVEDEAPIAAGLEFNFQQEGLETVVAPDGPSALEAIEAAAASGPPIDLVVLDLMLPGMSGYEICKEIRQHDARLPIMVLSARLHSRDRAHAFDCGADQYLTKPFELQELLSRARNLLKRRREGSAQGTSGDAASRSPLVYRFNGIVVDCRRFQVEAGGKSHSLTTMEMQLLQYFIENEGTVLSRDRILEDVWGQSAEFTTRSIDNFVMRLRKMIEPDPSQPRHILSVRGTGYRFVAESLSATPGAMPGDDTP